MTRRDFIRNTVTGALAFGVVLGADGWIVVPVVIVGCLVIAGGIWAGWELAKLAKEKLWPCPPVPGATNAVPVIPPTCPSNTNHPARSELPSSLRMGDRESSSGMIWAIDTATRTEAELALVTLPDGKIACNYATATVEKSSDGQTWSAVGLMEIWFSGTCYVVRLGSQVEYGLITKETPMFVTACVPDCCGEAANLRL